MQTFTGRAVVLLDPKPEDIDIMDIAHAISMQCRYNGHTSRFYSVAEHCILVSQNVPEEDALWALLHDATEAYVGDMVRPLKRSIPAFSAAEKLFMDAIVERFDLGQYTMPDSVRDADMAILFDERAELLTAPPQEWDLQGGALGVDIVGYSPAVAKELYLVRFEELTGTEIPR